MAISSSSSIDKLLVSPEIYAILIPSTISCVNRIRFTGVMPGVVGC